jgi:hypothetical protein
LYWASRPAFGPEGIYGKWVRGLNTVIKIDDSIFLYGGISPKYASYSLKKINDRVREELDDFRKLQGGNCDRQEGPLWYRGLANGGEDALEGHAKKILKNYGVERIVIGHTFTDGAVTGSVAGCSGI